MKKQFAVFGLGGFGHSVAIKMENLGCDVIVVDNSTDKIQEIADFVTLAIKADIEDPEVIRSLGAKNLDGVVVAISANMEASILATILAKEIGVPYVIAKARDALHAKILKKVGADAIVYPEQEMGSRIAKSLVSANFADWIELSPEYSLVETKIPEEWVGKTLMQLQVRDAYGINVVGIVRDQKVEVTLNPHLPLPDNCMVILIGADKVLKDFKSR